MDFPIGDLMDEDACYHFLVNLLHPKGLHCPKCGAADGFLVHRFFREPVLDFRCTHCRCVFNAFTGTVFQGTRRRPSQLVLILRGFARGETTARMARELGIGYNPLLRLRHLMQGFIQEFLDAPPATDAEVEVDEMFQNAGEKGQEHDDPDDPPRGRANKRRGHGTFANDRPPVIGTVGRESKQVRLEVVETTNGPTCEGFVVGAASAAEGTTVYTDEWGGYNRLDQMGYTHKTVCHGEKEWARDDDRDGKREVHVNTMEGIWTGLRNFLRPFRGVSKWYYAQYVAMFQWAHNLKKVTDEFLQGLLGVFANPNYGG